MSSFALSAVIMLSQARVPSMNHNMPQCRFFTDALFFLFTYTFKCLYERTNCKKCVRKLDINYE